jgi:hypothetical protein
MATCLSLIQTICAELGLTQPTSAVGSSDQQIANLVALCNREGQTLAKRTDWTALQLQASFTTQAQEDQGAMATIAPGIKFILNDTIWNRDLRRPVFGPATPQEWQQQQAYAINGPWSRHRVQGGRLLMFPVPVAGQHCYFEYATKNWCTNAAGDASYSAWAHDDDVLLLDEDLLILGTIWRWKKHKGFEYAEDFADYERQVLDAMARDGGKPNLNMTGSTYDIQPVVIVPSGSWNL